MKPNETEILQLREMVEESVSRKMKTPADFQFLTGVIQERCKETLGVTTLKRIWAMWRVTTPPATPPSRSSPVAWVFTTGTISWPTTTARANPRTRCWAASCIPTRSRRRGSCASPGRPTAVCCCAISAKEVSWWWRAKTPSSSPAIPFRVPVSSSGSRSTSTTSCTATTPPPSSWSATKAG